MSAPVAPLAFAADDADQRIARLERALARERRARIEAEDVAERGLRDAYLAKNRLELLNRIADVANESNDPRETLRTAAKEICLTTGWAIGTILIRTGEAGNEQLIGTDLWFAHDPDLMFAFAQASQRLIAWPCASPPGRLFIDHHPIWTPDIHALPAFSRSALAAQANLRAGVAAPILMGGELVAAIEFFSTDAKPPEPEMLDLLIQIGAQAGRVFKRERHAQRLIESATTDALTRLPNRTLFDMRINELFEPVQCAEQTRLSLIYIDLDGFKLVNDTMGHQAGDKLLIGMTQSLSKVIDAKSRQFPDANLLLARMGGDEFTVMVHASTHRRIAEELADEIHASLVPNFCFDDIQIRAAASIGIAHDDATYDTPDALIRDADVAMYEAKFLGRTDGDGCRTVVFDAQMRAEALERLEIENALRRALAQRSFVLNYQPIVSLDQADIVGFEALLRWPRTDGTPMSPDHFIAIAEDSGLIIPVGSWVLREACRAAARWRNDPRISRPFFISVNVAPSQIQQPNFSDLVRSILLETGAHPENIAIELTERAAVLNPKHVTQILNELRQMGMKISIDDFGTGYSSLSHIQSMPFDTIKIDRSFVMGEHANDDHWTIVNAMIKLGQAMQMNVIAEGIETEAQLAHLKGFGCHYGQGFLFDHAMPEQHAMNLLI